ncbi:MAG TPA: hypothetical protein VEQ85_10515 [Lacipirellulaceae bacterium]|nr:hypothetical protein [Lacipirellulaceae bacterium]
MIRLCALGLLASLVALAPARAAVLYERTLGLDRSANIFATDEFKLNLRFANSYFSPTNPVTLFNDVTITPASVGQVFEATAASDPAFHAAVARLTDSLNQNVRLLFAEASSGRAEQRGWSESSFFGKSASQIPDLAGSIIEAIRLRVDTFTLLPPAPISPLAVTGPAVLLSLTFTVVGPAVPEPGALGVCALGMAILCGAPYTRAVVSRRRRAA